MRAVGQLFSPLSEEKLRGFVIDKARYQRGRVGENFRRALIGGRTSFGLHIIPDFLVVFNTERIGAFVSS